MLDVQIIRRRVLKLLLADSLPLSSALSLLTILAPNQIIRDYLLEL
jgi:hypothetical protein